MPKIMTKMNAIVKEYVRHVIIASIIIILVSVNYYYITYNWLNVHGKFFSFILFFYLFGPCLCILSNAHFCQIRSKT